MKIQTALIIIIIILGINLLLDLNMHSLLWVKRPLALMIQIRILNSSDMWFQVYTNSSALKIRRAIQSFVWCRPKQITTAWKRKWFQIPWNMCLLSQNTQLSHKNTSVPLFFTLLKTQKNIYSKYEIYIL